MWLDPQTTTELSKESSLPPPPPPRLKGALEHSVCCKPRAPGSDGGWGQPSKTSSRSQGPTLQARNPAFKATGFLDSCRCHSCQPLPLARRWVTQVWTRTWQGDATPEGLQAGSSKKGHLLKQFVYRQPSRCREVAFCGHQQIWIRLCRERFKGPAELTILASKFWNSLGGAELKIWPHTYNHCSALTVWGKEQPPKVQQQIKLQSFMAILS